MREANKIWIAGRYCFSANDTDEEYKRYSLWQSNATEEYDFIKFFDDISAMSAYVKKEIIHKKILNEEIRDIHELLKQLNDLDMRLNEKNKINKLYYEDFDD